MIIKALNGEALPVYGRGDNVRDWLHVEDHAEALITVVERGKVGETYLIGGSSERSNLDVVRLIAHLVDEMAEPLSTGGRRADLIRFVSDRPGHDFRYAMDITKIEGELGWRPSRTFEQGLRETVAWYLRNGGWWRSLTKNYAGQRLGNARVPVPAEA
jgi:dTDP-glucose 4,6-dehydratase